MLEPWSKFFWADYESDEGLRLCSLAAQGLWMRMLCTMARATPKGELRIAGEPCSIQDLAKLVGESDVTVATLCDELRRRGVFSVTRAAVIFSRRMRKDAEISRKRAEAGKLGGKASLGKHDFSQVCSSKSEANKEAKPKPQKPEARSQKEKPPPSPVDGGGGEMLDDEPPPKAEQEGKYAFRGKVIRLVARDLDGWKARYHAIPDIKAELWSLDDWIARPDIAEAKRKNWFHTISACLNRKHQELIIVQQAGGSPPGQSSFVDSILRKQGGGAT